MTENLDILDAAVSLLVKAALLAARCSGRARRRSLKRLAARDTDAKAKEILFLKDRMYQLEIQLSILQKQLNKKGKSPRYTLRERLLILWYMEAFQIPRQRVSAQMTCTTAASPRNQNEMRKPSPAISNVASSWKHASQPIASRTPRSFCGVTPAS